MAAAKHEYAGVILCAGKGSRIDPFNTHWPKPMLPIVNKPIVEHQLGYLRALGIRDVILVVGHLKEAIQEHFGDGSRLGMRIRYVEQRQTLGIAHAVMQLEPVLERPFVLFLGDIFYVPRRLESLLELFEAGGVSAVLAVKREEDPLAIQKNFSVSLNDKGMVVRVVEKPRHLINDLKGCGIYLFAPEIFDAIRQTPRTAMRDEYELTNSIQILIDDGYHVRAADVVEWDYNVTFPSDLLDCNLEMLRRAGESNAIDASARIHPGARLSGAVIGAGVSIERPIAVRDSIVLPGTSLLDEEDLVRTIASREVRIRCGPPGTAPAGAQL